MNVFHDLPTVKQIDLLSNWLRYADIVNLDSATCCNAFRSEFLRVLSSPECKYEEFQCFMGLNKENWFIARGLRLKNVRMLFDCMVNDTARMIVLENIGSTVQCLALSCAPASAYEAPLDFDEVFYDIGRTCRELRKLHVCDANLNGTFSLLLQYNPHLEELVHMQDTPYQQPFVVGCTDEQSMQALRPLNRPRNQTT